MNGKELLGRVCSVRENLADVERALLRPSAENWGISLSGLEHAAGLLAQAERAAREAAFPDLDQRDVLRRELGGLRNDLRRVHELMQAAADYHTGWGHLIALATAGYARTGTVVPISAAAQISVRG